MKTPYIIAEIGINHNGDFGLAQEMIKAAAISGTDAVKLQSFKPTDLYLSTNKKSISFLEKLHFSVAEHVKLKKYADKLNVDFLSTPFSLEWVDVLDSIGVGGFKVASMDLNNHLLLKAVARKKKTVFLSCGASEVAEVLKSVKVLKQNGVKKIVVLHCISNYPTKPEDVHLGFMKKLGEITGLPVGFSDHTEGIQISLAAVALGAAAIEKHFTLDKNMPGPDQKSSCDPSELKDLSNGAKAIVSALKQMESVKKRPDMGNKTLMRRGIYAGKNIKKGDKITLEMLNFVRPEVTPMEKLGSILKARAIKDFKVNEPIQLK